MLKNTYLLAKIGADTTENERHFVLKIAKQISNYPTPGKRRGPSGNVVAGQSCGHRGSREGARRLHGDEHGLHRVHRCSGEGDRRVVKEPGEHSTGRRLNACC